MALESGSLLYYGLAGWPVVLAAVFAGMFWKRLDMGKRVAVLVVGAILGYGIQVLVAYPLYLWIVATGKSLTRPNFEFGPGEAICVVYGSAILVSSLVLWFMTRLLANGTHVSRHPGR